MKLMHCAGIVGLSLVFSYSLDAQTFLSNGCSLSGSAKSARLQGLDISKDRFSLPTAHDLDTNITLEAILNGGDDTHRWSTNRAATIEGYVFFVKPGGAETCNCHALDKTLYDTHIELTVGSLPSETDGLTGSYFSSHLES
jgi:hypothetical protein